MYKPKAIPAIRLQKLFDLPSADDVSRCMSQCEKMRGRTVELPFAAASINGDQTHLDCVLAGIWNKEDEAPTWIFYIGDSPKRDARWRHQTRDLGLVASLAQRECLGDQVDSSASDRLSSGKKAEDGQAADGPPDQGPVEDTQGFGGQGFGGQGFGGQGFGAPAPPFQPMGIGNIGGMGAVPGMPAMGIGGLPTMPMQAMPNPNNPNNPNNPSNPNSATLPWPAPSGQGFNNQPDQSMTGNRIVAVPFADVPKQASRVPSMEGELSNVKPPNLLQSLGMGKMTGLLNVSYNDTLIEIWVDDGQPIHATTEGCKGEAALMELLTWDAGKFQFFPGEKTTERTILKRLDNLLMESSPLIDQYRYLNHSGVSMDSYLIRKHQNLSEAEFEQRIARGAKADMLKQKQFYQAIDHQINLFEILRKMPLAKVEWIPLVYNLVVCDLVSLSAVATQGQKTTPIEAMGMDRSAVQIMMQGVYRSETDLVNYPAILYFLEQEFFRWEHAGTPFSIVTFEMCRRTAGGIEPLSLPATREAVKRISTVKRNVDLFSHFEATGFMLVLPFTKVQAAELVAKRIVEVLRDASLGGELDSQNLALAFGVAGVPEDCQDLGLLLNAARQAINQAKQSGSPVVAFQSTQRT